MLRILAIGNSFSDDATARLAAIAKADGVELTAVNLVVGGCSLEQHVGFLHDGSAPYIYEVDGVLTERFVSVPEILADGVWDVVTIQQASHFSGKPETYFPYAEELMGVIREAQPTARILFHQTWAYEIDSNHGAFPAYGSSQIQMYEAIVKASQEAAERLGIGLIRTGEVIQRLRAEEPFDYAKGGISLCRDGFHLNLTYGRYAAAAVWYETLTGRDIRKNSYCPEGCEEGLITEMKRVVSSVLR